MITSDGPEYGKTKGGGKAETGAEGQTSKADHRKAMQRSKRRQAMLKARWRRLSNFERYELQ